MDNCYRKILQINVTANWGSTGRIAEEIGQCIISEDWESYVAYGRSANSSTSHLMKIGHKCDVLFHVLQSRLFDRHGLASKTATRTLIKQIETLKPDIIHLHNIHGYYINYQILFAYLSESKIPIVWTLHDCWAFTGHCSYYDFINCDKWKTQCELCPLLKSYPASWGYDNSRDNYLLKRTLFSAVPSLTLIPVSNWLAGEIRTSFLNRHPIKVINNGVDIDTFRIMLSQKQVYMPKERTMILGVASVWSPRKGLNDFIELSKIVPNDCTIVLLGLTKEQIKFLPQNVIGITRVESVVKLANLYSSADIFINPTWEDNFPTTNLEALACGTPVVTYKTGGSVEAVTPRTGFVVEKGDVNGLLSAIQVVREKGKTFYANSCRTRAVEFYNKKERYAEYIELYKNLLNIK